MPTDKDSGTKPVVGVRQTRQGVGRDAANLKDFRRSVNFLLKVG